MGLTVSFKMEEKLMNNEKFKPLVAIKVNRKKMFF